MPESSVRILPGAPARILAGAAPVLAIAMMVLAARRGGFDQGPEDPVPPWSIAAVTLLGAFVLSWRALTQHAELDATGLRSRNLLSAVVLDWEQVVELRTVRRPGLVAVEIVIAGVRRRSRLGAATRLDDRTAAQVLELMDRSPEARARLVQAEP